jgi:hypothetical protein
LVAWGSTLAGSASADETFTATSAIAVPIAPGNPRAGLGSFDIGFDDPVLQLYLLADRSNAGLDVVDTSAVSNVSGNVGGIGVLAAGQFVGLTCPEPNPIPPASPPVIFTNGDCGGGSGPNGVITVHHKQGSPEAWAGDAPVLSFSCANQTINNVVTTVCTSNVVTPSSVKVVDLKTGGVIRTISTGTTDPRFAGKRRADELCWDPRDNLVLVANDEAVDNYISFISTDTSLPLTAYTLVDRIKLDGTDTKHKAGKVKATNGIEQCQWNPRTGLFYLNIPENHGPGDDSKPGAVMVLDPTSVPVQVVKVFPINFKNKGGQLKCAGPQGMAIGPDNQILLGCSNAGPDSVIIKESDGSLIADLVGRNGADESTYNPGDNHYLLAASNHGTGTTPRLSIADALAEKTESPDSDAVSAGGSHSVAADPFKGHVFVPVNNTAAGAKSLICSTASGGLVPDSQGCIAVFTATGPRDKCSADGAAVVAAQFDDPKLAKRLCASK